MPLIHILPGLSAPHGPCIIDEDTVLGDCVKATLSYLEFWQGSQSQCPGHLEVYPLVALSMGCVREVTPFLEFDDMNPGNASAKDAIFPKVTEKSIEVLAKHARYYMRCIQVSLTWPKILCNLWPL